MKKYFFILTIFLGFKAMASPEYYKKLKNYAKKDEHQALKNFQDFFSRKLLSKTWTSLSENPESLMDSLKSYKSYNCLHQNKFEKGGVHSILKRMYKIPLSIVPENENALLWAMERISSHINSPGGEPALGTLRSYVYKQEQLKEGMELDFYEDNGLAPAVSLGQTLTVKYCFDPPLLSSKCNTLNHRLEQLGEKHMLLMTSLVHPNFFAGEAHFFKEKEQLRNTNDSGSAFVLAVEKDGHIFTYESAVFESSQSSTVREFKLFGERISRDQCEKNGQLLAKRIGLVEN